MGIKKLSPTTRLILASVILGVVGALGAQIFLWLLHLVLHYGLLAIGHYASIDISEAHQMGKAPPVFGPLYWWLPVITTLGGLAAGILIYGLAPETEGHGTDAALNSFHRNNGRSRARVPVVKTVVSALTIGSGGSGGREGPTAQIASGAGAIFGAIFKLSDQERRYLVLIGMAAGLSAIFKSPLGCAIFAVEILYSRMAFEGGALLYTLVSGSVAYAVMGLFSGYTPLFLLLPMSHGIENPLDLFWFGLLGILAGGLGAVLPKMYYGVRDTARALKLPNFVKPAIGGFLVGVIGIFLAPAIGGGYGYIQFALQGGSGLAAWVLLLLALSKMVTLSLTIGSGGSGGLFGPTLYVGAVFGAAFAGFLQMFGVPAVDSWFAVVGMAAVFAGAARVPIASMVMVIEMTGGFHLITPTMLAVALAFIVQSWLTRHAKYPTLYEGQVPTPAQSPVYRSLYYETAVELLRSGQVKMDANLLSTELQNTLGSGVGVLLSHDGERLYSLRVSPGAPAIGQEIRSLGLADMGVIIVGIVRGEGDVTPSGATRLQMGDGLLVASHAEGVESFKRLIQAPGDKLGQLMPLDAAGAKSKTGDVLNTQSDK